MTGRPADWADLADPGNLREQDVSAFGSDDAVPLAPFDYRPLRFPAPTANRLTRQMRPVVRCN